MKQKKGRNKFNLKKEYREGLDYIGKSRDFIYFIIFVFFLFALIGFFVPAPESLVEQILNFIKELLAQTEGMSAGELIKFIFLNNIQSSLFGMILGIFFGLFPIIFAITNGYILGFVARMSVNTEGVLSLWRLFPHGIFELPAIFISLGLGLKLGTFIFQKKVKNSLKVYLWNSLRVFLFIIIPLLVIAAIIEGFLISIG